MAETPSISLCIIARDEERVLGRCLAGALGLVQELILVDTGSTDRTRDIARAAGARVVEMPWSDDFSEPRNVAIRRARGDWILMLDADEELTPTSHDGIRRAIAHDDFEVGMFRLHDAVSLDTPAAEVLSGIGRFGESIDVPRLLRRLPDLQYRGVVHECVTDWMMEHGGRVRLVDADLVHLGRVPEIVRNKGKSRRNIELLRRRCREEPTDFTAHGYLAQELLGSNQLDEAEAVARSGLRVLACAPRRPGRTVLRLVVACMQVGLLRRDLDAVMSAAAVGESLEGVHPDLDHLCGCAHEDAARRACGMTRVEQLTLARSRYEAAVEHASRRLSLRFVAGAGMGLTAVRLGAVLLQLGAWEQARLTFAGVKEERWRLAATLGSIEALVEGWSAGGRADELHAAERLLDSLPPTLDGFVLRARIEEARGNIPALRAALLAARSAEPQYLELHRQTLHVDLVHAAAIYAGAPLIGDSPVGVLSALMLGRAPATEVFGELRADLLVRLLRHLRSQGRRELLERLCEEPAQRVIPGLAALVHQTAGPLQHRGPWTASPLSSRHV